MNPHALYIVEKSCRNTGGSHETIKLHMFLFNAHQHNFFQHVLLTLLVSGRPLPA